MLAKCVFQTAGFEVRITDVHNEHVVIDHHDISVISSDLVVSLG